MAFQDGKEGAAHCPSCREQQHQSRDDRASRVLDKADCIPFVGW